MVVFDGDAEERRSLLYSECGSSVSSASNMSTLLHQNQRLIFKYPDGTFAYAFKQAKGKGDEEEDTWLHLRTTHPREFSAEQLNGNLSAFQVLQIEDEIEFLVNNLEFLVEPQQAISQYARSRNLLFLLLAINLVFEVLITLYVFRNEDFILRQLNQMYHIWHAEDFKHFFESITLMNTCLNTIMYFHGFYTIFTHKVTNYTVFTMLMIISIFFGILLTYLNVLNILMFVLKCFTYVYARYVLSQLYTVLMVPAAQNLQGVQVRDNYSAQLSRHLRREAHERGRDSSSGSEGYNYVPDVYSHALVH